MVQAAVFDLGYVYQTVALAKEVHEGTEINDLDDGTGVNRTFFRLGHDGPDHVIGFLDRVAVWRCDLDDAFVVDVDFRAGHFNDLADHFTAGADHFTDLVGWDLHRFDAWGVDREFTRAGDGFVHLAQNVHTARFGLCQSFLHDLGRDAGDLDVHLQRRDTCFGTGHFKVHVAKVVFVTQDVRQDRIGAVFFQDQTHGNTRDGCFQRHTCVHHGQGATANRRHRAGAVRFSDLGHNADGVGEVSGGRQNRLQRTPSQLAVTDFATAGATDTANFTNRIGREVIVQHEVGFEVAVQRIDELFVIAGAQSGHNQTLCFAACEQRRPVCAGQDAGFGHDVADFVGLTAVDTLTGFNHVTTQDGRFEAFQSGPEVRVFQLLVGQRCFDCFAGSGNSGGALLLVGDCKGGAHGVFASGLDSSGQVRIVNRLEVKRLFRGVFGQINDQVDNRLDLLVREFHRTQHFFFRQLIGFGFNHHHGFFGAGDNQIKTLIRVQAQVLHVVDGRVQNVIAILETNAAGTDRATERRAGNGQRRGGSDHGDHIGVIDQIVAENSTHHQNFVFEAGNEQRTDRTVDQTGCQGFLLGGAGLTLEEATRYFTGGVVFLLVVDGQRKEVLTGFLLACKGDVRHDAGFAQCRNHRTVCLTGHFASFQCQRLFAPLHGFFRYIKHLRFLFRPGSGHLRRGHIPPDSGIFFVGRWSPGAGFQIVRPYSSLPAMGREALIAARGPRGRRLQAAAERQGGQPDKVLNIL